MKIIKSDWNPTAESYLRSIPCGKDGYGLEDLRDDVQNGRASLYHGVLDDGKIAGACVVRIDDGELVAMDCAGDFLPAGVQRFIPLLHRLAQLNHCRSVRWHVTRKGMVKIARQAGYTLDAYVMRYTL